MQTYLNQLTRYYHQLTQAQSVADADAIRRIQRARQRLSIGRTGNLYYPLFTPPLTTGLIHLPSPDYFLVINKAFRVTFRKVAPGAPAVIGDGGLTLAALRVGALCHQCGAPCPDCPLINPDSGRAAGIHTRLRNAFDHPFIATYLELRSLSGKLMGVAVHVITQARMKAKVSYAAAG